MVEPPDVAEETSGQQLAPANKLITSTELKGVFAEIDFKIELRSWQIWTYGEARFAGN